jgi:hypothetical protein
MDEVRINKVARSADWAKLEYENQKAGQTLLTLNPVGLRSAASGALRGEMFSVVGSASGVTFSLPAGLGRALLTVSDVRGKVLWSREADLGSSLTWSDKSLPAGLYSVRLTVKEGAQAGRTFHSQFTSPGL